MLGYSSEFWADGATALWGILSESCNAVQHGVTRLVQHKVMIFDVWWFMMIYDDVLWFPTIYDDLWWFITVRHDMMWCDMIGSDLIWSDMMWHYMIWYELIWFCIWYALTGHDRIWCISLYTHIWQGKACSLVARMFVHRETLTGTSLLPVSATCFPAVVCFSPTAKLCCGVFSPD